MGRVYQSWVNIIPFTSAINFQQGHPCITWLPASTDPLPRKSGKAGLLVSRFQRRSTKARRVGASNVVVKAHIFFRRDEDGPRKLKRPLQGSKLPTTMIQHAMAQVMSYTSSGALFPFLFVGGGSL